MQKCEIPYPLNKPAVLDTVEALFSGLNNTAILRAELRRLFRWLKEKKVTAIITGERGERSLTRYGLEEYVADCVILLDHRVNENVATRRLRIVKYRGTNHGTSEYPFLIGENGISIIPITSVGLKNIACTDRVSTGVPRLDIMMDGKGLYRDSNVLVSGTAGSGKTSLAAHFANAAAMRGERCLWFAFEESSSQIIRNMLSIGIDLERAVRQGRLRFYAERPTISGLETHLVNIHKEVGEFKPQVVIVDPITNFTALGSNTEIKAMLTRLIDFFKMQQITALFTTLSTGRGSLESMDLGVSSLMDTWLLLRDIESGTERNRVMHLLKSRGMAHSNQVREFLLTDHGVELRDTYLGPSGKFLTGSARTTQEAIEKAEAVERSQEVEGRKFELERKKLILDAKIAALKAEFETEQAEILKGLGREKLRSSVQDEECVKMAHLRQIDAPASRKQEKQK